MEKQGRRDFLKRASLGTVGAIATVVGVKETEANAIDRSEYKEFDPDAIIYEKGKYRMPTKMYEALVNNDKVIVGDPVYIPTYDVNNEPTLKEISEQRNNKKIKIEIESVVINEEGTWTRVNNPSIQFYGEKDIIKPFAEMVDYTFSIRHSGTEAKRLFIRGILKNKIKLTDMQINQYWTIDHEGTKYKIALISCNITEYSSPNLC